MTINNPPAFLEVVALEEVAADEFLASFTAPWELSTYGGQIAAQTLMAAGLTVPQQKAPHSIHLYFMRPGDPREPMSLKVTRDRDGRSYSTRHVTAQQGGRLVARAMVSFHVWEGGDDVQIRPMPAIERADALEQAGWIRAFSADMRRRTGPTEPTHPPDYWVRCVLPLGDSPLLNAAALTYLSDMSTGLTAYTPTAGHQLVSLDHVVWFHRPAQLNAWTLFSLRPESMAGGRGLYQGSVFDASGTLVATLTQESLFRLPSSIPQQRGKRVQHEPA